MCFGFVTLHVYEEFPYFIWWALRAMSSVSGIYFLKLLMTYPKETRYKVINTGNCLIAKKRNYATQKDNECK